MAAPQNMSPTWRHGPLSTERQACSAPVEMDRSWYRNTTCGSLATSYSIIQYPNQCSVNPVKALPLNKTVVELMHGSETVFPVSQRHLESQQQSMDWIALTQKKPRNPDASYQFLGFSSRFFVRKAGPNMFALVSLSPEVLSNSANDLWASRRADRTDRTDVDTAIAIPWTSEIWASDFGLQNCAPPLFSMETCDQICQKLTSPLVTSGHWSTINRLKNKARYRCTVPKGQR